MRKIVVMSVVLSLLCVYQSNGQVGKFLKNVKNSVTQDLLGSKSDKPQESPEPPCACDPAELVMELGKLRIDYSELRIDVLDDGTILLRDNMDDNYYIYKNGVTDGPFKPDNQRVRQIELLLEGDADPESLFTIYKDYISKSDGRYQITFDGTKYGPYARIDKFILSKSRDKFAAIVVETELMSEDEGKKLEEAINNASSNQEKMELAMRYSQLIQQRMAAGGGVDGISSKIVTNAASNADDMLIASGGQFYNNLKYDDILVWMYDKVTDLSGKTVIVFSDGMGCIPENMFISSDNSRYACYNYGTLRFSDGKELSELFNPHLVKEGGKIYIAYMYYSPKKSSILQCRIPF